MVNSDVKFTIICVTTATIFSSIVAGETFKINHSFHFDYKCLIYLIKECSKQYTGETIDQLVS